jgi:hypothetical protein
VTTQSVRNTFIDSLSQYSKHSDELNAGGSEILGSQPETKSKVSAIYSSKKSNNEKFIKTKKLPDLQQSYQENGGKGGKGLGFGASDSEQDGIKQLPLIKGGQVQGDAYSQK